MYTDTRLSVILSPKLITDKINELKKESRKTFHLHVVCYSSQVDQFASPVQNTRT